MERERRFEERLKLYPKDAKYLKELAQNLDLPNKSLNRLYAVMGEQELFYYLKQAEYENFLGNSPFRINLHTHTSASDGVIDPKDFLDSVLSYMQKNDILKMIVAVTDHDILDALPIILNQLITKPENYHDIRLVLGCELSTAYTDNDASCPIDFELLYYGLNPFDKTLQELLSSLRENRLKALPHILEDLQRQYPNAHFDLTELKKGRANLSKGLGCNLPYDFYNYAKGKINDPSKDNELHHYLFNIGGPNAQDKSLKTLNLVTDLLEAYRKKAKTGFLSVAHPGRIKFDQKLTDEFIWNTKAGGQDPGRALLSELLRFVHSNGVQGLEIYYGNYNKPLNTAFNNVRFSNHLHGETEQWMQSILQFADDYEMIKTGGNDTHGTDFGPRK